MEYFNGVNGKEGMAVACNGALLSAQHMHAN